MKTSDCLFIHWLGYGEEVPGLSVYGLWSPGVNDEPTFPAAEWPRTEFSSSRLYGPDWEVLTWDVRVEDWQSPEEWKPAVVTLLERFTDAGALVAWCGLIGFFADPPFLFAPEMMSGGVYALRRRDGFSIVPASLDEPYEAVQDSVLEDTRTYVQREAPALNLARNEST